MAFVPTSDCRFNCHGMIYVSEGKLIVTVVGAPIFKPHRGGGGGGRGGGGAIAPPTPLATTPLVQIVGYLHWHLQQHCAVGHAPVTWSTNSLQ